MLRTLCGFFCLLSFACATAMPPAPIDNCRTVPGAGDAFSCVDQAGLPYILPWSAAEDLVCFKSKQFQAFANSCHKK